MKYLGIKFRRHDQAGVAQIRIDDITSGEEILIDKLIDLYISNVSYASDEISEWVFWYAVDDEDHVYDITIINAGLGAAVLGGYVDVVEFLEKYENDPAQPRTSLLLLWQNDKPHIHQFSNLATREKTDLLKSQSFLANGTDTTFVLSDENTASFFHSFSTDGGISWRTPYDLEITWGNNVPLYDDEQIDTEEGYFGIRFFTAPVAGTNIIIRYNPMANRAKLYTVFDLARSSDDSFVDYKTSSRLLNYSLELFK